jgi:thioredoxin reductase
MERCDVAIVGAGPYGLSAASHLCRVTGLDIRLFGEPMSFWERYMPQRMFLRSPWDASHISDPNGRFTLDDYREASESPALAAPVPIRDYIEYGRWFYQQIGIPAEGTRVRRIDRAGDKYRLVLERGADVRARHVVVAGGLQPFAQRPSVFDRVPPPFATHTSEQPDFGQFRGKDVLVIGGGTSAIEAAGFLCEAGARIEILMRGDALRWPRQWMHAKAIGWMFYGRGDVGPAGISLIVQRPSLFRRLPRWVQTWWGRRAIRPSALPRLKPTIAGVPIHPRRCVLDARVERDRLRLWLNDGTQRMVDHVVLGTGYRVNVARYPFLSREISESLALVQGYPQLDAGFETSLAGLHFVGAPAAWSFGPLMRFVAGTEYCSRALARRIAWSRVRRTVFGGSGSSRANGPLTPHAKWGAM